MLGVCYGGGFAFVMAAPAAGGKPAIDAFAVAHTGIKVNVQEVHTDNCYFSNLQATTSIPEHTTWSHSVCVPSVLQ